jgi:hypothetical protein
MRHGALLAFLAAAVLMIPLERFVPGVLLGLLSLALVLRVPDSRFRLRMVVLLTCVALLALAPIHTDRSNGHFLSLGLLFLTVVLGPALIMRRLDPGVIRFRLWPRRFSRLDLFYTAISIPLAWAILHWYFFVVNPELPTHWPMPQPRSAEGLWRLFVGINAVGIWDELFFVNTVFALLRSCFSFRVANLAQAVVYSSVLTDMAFTGVGPILVFIFALTQGFMFEKGENLLYVLIVHLIVDAFLVAAILAYHYPGFTPGWL